MKIPSLWSLAMISTVDPECMTSDERRREVASILARGLLRYVRLAKTGDSAISQEARKKPRNSTFFLDRPAKTRLSVAQRPAC